MASRPSAAPPLPPAADDVAAAPPAAPTAHVPAEAESKAPSSVDAARAGGVPPAPAAAPDAEDAAAPPEESKAAKAAATAGGIPPLATVFGACDTDSDGMLDEAELGFALQACGLYPTPALLAEAMRALGISPPLERRALERLVRALEQRPTCRRGLKAVPYARRGITLRQLKDVAKATLATGWIPTKCAEFNAGHAAAIAAGEAYAMAPNLYALDAPFVRATTSADPAARDGIPQEVLEAARVPPRPQEACCYAQLLNPDGLAVDVFVSHFWGHPFQRTVAALTRLAEDVHEKAGRASADDVVFWVCLFALNQHRAAEEVGESPEQGPFKCPTTSRSCTGTPTVHACARGLCVCVFVCAWRARRQARSTRRSPRRGTAR